MQDISLHLLDMIENSVRAGASLVEIEIKASVPRNRISFRVKDNGCGMDSETVENALNPFYTTKSERIKKIGLGIPLFKQNAEACGGDFTVASAPGEGTEIVAHFKFDHIDRMPVGNLADTMLGAIIGHPENDFLFYIRREGFNGAWDFELDTREIKQELDGVPITYPDVIGFLTEIINEGVTNTKMEEL